MKTAPPTSAMRIETTPVNAARSYYARETKRNPAMLQN
jgi:hypothetical protein